MAVPPPEHDVVTHVAPDAAADAAASMRGTEWIIDARGCQAETLRDVGLLKALFDRVIDDLGLTPVAPPVWHAFPGPGGLTGFVILAESHLSCHTFPEFGSICVNVFCCRARADFDAATLMAELLGATETRVRRVERHYGHALPGSRLSALDSWPARAGDA